jgi:hypothetical protein
MNEFVIKNGFVSKDSSTIDGSLSINGSLTGVTNFSAQFLSGDGSGLTNVPSGAFTGGTIVGATSFGARITYVVVPLTFSSTTVTDLSLGNEFTLTLTGSTTLQNPINATIDGQAFKYIFRQNAIGGYTITYDTKFRFGTEIGLPAIDTNPNKLSYLGVRYNQADDRFDIIAFVSGY